MKKYIGRWLAKSCLVMVLSGGVLARGGDAASVTANACKVPDAAQVQQRMSGLAVPFEANTGQEDQRVAFTARTSAGTLFVTRAGQLVHSFPGPVLAGPDGREPIHERGRGWALIESFVDAHPVVRGDAPSATRVSRFIGSNLTRCQTSVPTFDRVALGEAWPGIEVELAARGNSVEKLFTVAEGADAGRIAISLRGAERLELAADGALIAHTGNGPVSFTTPRAWQDIKGERRPVSVAYTLTGSRYGFHLGDYNQGYPVVIDPILQATYLGHSGSDSARAIALDMDGNVFVAGLTSSTDFPVTAGAQQIVYGGDSSDAFVAKLTNDLTTLTQATYLGGGAGDIAYAIALDTGGNVFVAGSTLSTNFPNTTGGVQAAYGGAGPAMGTLGDAFVAKLDNDLTTLIQSTYLGASADEYASAIALDTGGNVFVTGLTNSTNFPHMAGGAQTVMGGSLDAFVAKLNNGLTATGPLTRATYLGGSGLANSGHDGASAIALDTVGNVFVAGFTFSSSFPHTPGGTQAVYGGGSSDAFVAKLDNGLTAFVATYLGGSGDDAAYAIALDTSGNVFVAGSTNSTATFPVTPNAAQITYGGGLLDAFVAKLNNGLTKTAPLTRATYLGGGGRDAANTIALDTDGNVFVAGLTSSTNFPHTTNGAQDVYGGGSLDAFVARLDNGLTTQTQSTYLGGSGGEEAFAIALHPINNNVFVAGNTTSGNFPGTPGGAQGAFGGGFNDAFVARLTRGLHDLGNSTANDDGDPHITTTNGIHYNFQSAGEFTALRDGAGMVIQTRQSPTSTFGPFFDGYTGLTTCVSLNTALAARVGRHRVTYQPNFNNPADPSGLQLRVDGVLTPLSPAGINLSGGGRVVQTGGALEIDFPDGTVLIATPYWAPPQWFLNIGVYRTEASEGIMGAVPQGSWLPALPNGASVGQMPAVLGQRYATLNQTFANAWRVSDETSLFDYAPGTSTATFTFPDWPAESGSCVLPQNPQPAKPIDLSRARKICRRIADKTRNADCVFDVAATGVPGFAKAYLLTQRIQEGATTIAVSDNLEAINAQPTKPVHLFTATVTRLMAGGRTPIGRVQFMLDGEKTGRPVRLDKDGVARWKAASLKPGEHRLSASYLPHKWSVFLPSSSAEKVVVLRGAR